MLLASALALLLLGVAIRLLFASLSTSTASAARVELQQRSLVVSERILADLSFSSRGGVAFQDSTSSLAIHPRRRDNGIWSSEVVLYRCAPPELRRLTTPRPDPGPRAYRPNTPEQWLSLLTAPQKETYRTEGVSRMTATLGEGPLIQLTLEITRGNLSLTNQRALYLRQGN